MEASRFGFGDDVAPAFKFDPTDADLVAHYLLPRALGRPVAYPNAVIADDPASAPPWELLRRNNHGGSDHAFFFGPGTDKTKNGGRKSRVVRGGGSWQGDGSEEVVLTLVRGDGAEVDIKYKCTTLAYSANSKRGNSTGFVMHEFEIVEPPLPGAVLYRIRLKNRARKIMDDYLQQQAEAAAMAQALAEATVAQQQEQPGPNHRGAVKREEEGTQADGFHASNVEMGGYYHPSLHCGGNSNPTGETGSYCPGGDNILFNSSGDDFVFASGSNYGQGSG